jgi:hypothetical protein
MELYAFTSFTRSKQGVSVEGVAPPGKRKGSHVVMLVPVGDNQLPPASWLEMVYTVEHVECRAVWLILGCSAKDKIPTVSRTILAACI